MQVNFYTFEVHSNRNLMSTLQARNEAIINTPVESIWAIITDIGILHKVNPGVVKASGRMDVQGETRTCEINNNGRKGTMIEKLIEMVPQKEELSDKRFIFNLETLADKTKVVNESYYKPANLIAKIMNGLMMKRMILKAKEQILSNMKLLTEK